MGYVPSSFKQEILDELNYYTTFTKPVKTFFLVRSLIRNLPLSRMHPNPEDEFTHPDIGPNEEILKEYTTKFAKARTDFGSLGISPIIVQRLNTGGFMILNGHHRWLAAKRVGLKKLPVIVTNATHEKDILAKMKKSNHTMCVSFDLDEVLISKEGNFPIDELPFPKNKLYPMPLRKNAGDLFSALQELGFDVWVYTCNYLSPEKIQRTFKAHHGKADAIINGIKHPKSNQKLKNAFTQKYQIIVHIDTEHLLWVNTALKDYDIYDLPQDETWASTAAEKVKELLLKEKTSEESIGRG